MSRHAIDELLPGFTERSDRGRKNNKRGKTYEREVANALKTVFPRARRLFGQSREGHEAPDVGGTPYWIECAKGATNAIHAKMRQGLHDSAASESEYGGAPVAVFSHPGALNEHLVTMRREDWLALVKKAWGKK